MKFPNLEIDDVIFQEFQKKFFSKIFFLGNLDHWKII